MNFRAPRMRPTCCKEKTEKRITVKKNESVKRSETSELKPDESLVADVVAPGRKDVLFRGWIRKSGPALRAFCSGRNESGKKHKLKKFLK